jgi:hypothetical protein
MMKGLPLRSGTTQQGRRLPNSRRFLPRQIIDEENWVVDDKGGWSSTIREGVDEEIPDVEGQNSTMVNIYSTLEDPAPTVVTTVKTM